MDLNNILSVVLAGGKSHRFGRDKSQVKLDNKLLIDYILNVVVSEFNETLIVANEPIKFMQSNKISITKDFQSGLGPLGGVLTAMKWVKEKNKKYKWISTFPVDTPFFSKKELKFFYKNIDINKNKLFFIRNNNTRHNIFGLWSLDLMEKLEIDLIRGERKVEIWADSVGVSVVNIDYQKPDPFFNINTREDLDKAIKILKNDQL
jgi:molybdopterin-guanine dinucleotide biosynthesis protein A